MDQTGHGGHRQHHQIPPAQGAVSQDGQLAAEVKEALLKGTESAGIDVKVDARGGVIRLHGVVDVLFHKTAAEEIARRIPGVTGIENEVTVANEEAVPDKELMERVTERLARSAAGRKTRMSPVPLRNCWTRSGLTIACSRCTATPARSL